ncbi:MAG TPA: glycoside hydrolase family 3 N-terminal domain-containing protein [Verrucomicrobiae bacterium]|nr:glycoside hydrolase family 3 N-terminal domain-containing protein [Verrucomicrobiae bacterium]
MTTRSVGQLLTMGLPGPEPDPGLRSFIRATQPGGFILFGRNIETPAQLRHLTDELRSLCDIPPIITIDQEGGRVSRLNNIAECPPSADELRRTGDPALIAAHGALTARLLRLFGFNLDLAPVVDILLDPAADNSLPERCYGTTPSEVARNAGMFLRALQAGGVAATIKHFPGYSLCRADPHREFPVVARTPAELESAELAPFRALAAEAAAVMVGHAHYPALDPEPRPSSFSPTIISGLLRQTLGFPGLVITDDLEMGAIAKRHGPADTVRMAIAAGNDLLLFCHQTECVDIASRTLAKMPPAALEASLSRISNFKRALPPAPPWNDAEFREINEGIRELRETVNRR